MTPERREQIEAWEAERRVLEARSLLATQTAGTGERRLKSELRSELFGFALALSDKKRVKTSVIIERLEVISRNLLPEYGPLLEDQ